MPKIKVYLNGTDKNPFEKMGLLQNPFPQLAEAESNEAIFRLQKLGGPPIPKNEAEKYIRETLTGFSQEFVDLCVKNFEVGKYVEFTVTW